MNLRPSLQTVLRPLAHSLAGNPWVPPAMLAAVFFGGLLLEFSHRIGHDVGWLLVATNRLLDGANIYADDVIDFNPPLILYLFSPPVAASRWLGFSEIGSFRIYAALLAAASLLLSNSILKGVLRHERAQVRRYLLVLLAAVLIIDVSGSFGQREHFMVILLTPYLLVITARVQALDLRTLQMVLAAIAGGLAISLKPHYVLLLVVLELYVAVRRRSRLAWLRPDLLIVVSVGLLYLVSLFVFTPAYPFFVLPLSLDTYWVYQKPLHRLVSIQHLPLFLLPAVAVAVLRRTRALRELGWVLLLSAACSYVAYCLQGTGWPYHLLPCRSAAIAALVLPVVALLGTMHFEPAPLGRVARGLVAAVAALLTLIPLLAVPKTTRTMIQRSVTAWRTGQQPDTMGPLRQLVDQHARGGTIYSFTAGVTGGFPLVNYAGVAWSSRFSCLWPLAAVIRWQHKQSQSTTSPPLEEQERMAEIERYVIDAVIEDLEKRPPDVIFMDRPHRARRIMGRPFSYEEYFLRDHRFQSIWAQYRHLERKRTTDIYVRRKQAG